jgi:hypothetical protein
MLRDNQKEGFVEVVFRVTSDHQRKQLQALDLEAYDDEVIVSRRISETRSVARINGETVPAMKLKQVGSIFLDIHGQQEHQSLSKKQKHLWSPCPQPIRIVPDPTGLPNCWIGHCGNSTVFWDWMSRLTKCSRC